MAQSKLTQQGKIPKAATISAREFNKFRTRLKLLANSGKFDEAYDLSKRLTAQHPQVSTFAYWEAVLTAEDTSGKTKAENRARYRLAAKKIKRILKDMILTAEQRSALLNEYFWFSNQPYKQYLLGRKDEARGFPGGSYSTGVGAAQLAKVYAKAGKKALSLKWAIRSEQAWIRYFEHTPDWFNSYLFYAIALGLQGRLPEMENALAKAARILKKPKSHEWLNDVRNEVANLLVKLSKSRRIRR